MNDEKFRAVADVIDGDTLEIHDRRIRLHGIDTPESGQNCKDAQGIPYPCGQIATQALSNRITSQTLSCEQTDTDRYGRMVAVCYLGDADLNEWLVQSGYALAYRRYSPDYIAAEPTRVNAGSAPKPRRRKQAGARPGNAPHIGPGKDRS